MRIVLYASMQGVSVNAIADLRHIKLDTVESYLADAITAGKAYDWHRLNVPDPVLATVRDHASALLAAAAGGERRDISLDGSSSQQCLECSPVVPEGPCISGHCGESGQECEYLDVCCAQQAPEDQEENHDRIAAPKPQTPVPESGMYALTGQKMSAKWQTSTTVIPKAAVPNVLVQLPQSRLQGQPPKEQMRVAWGVKGL